MNVNLLTYLTFHVTALLYFLLVHYLNVLLYKIIINVFRMPQMFVLTFVFISYLLCLSFSFYFIVWHNVSLITEFPKPFQSIQSSSFAFTDNHTQMLPSYNNVLRIFFRKHTHTKTQPNTDYIICIYNFISPVELNDLFHSGCSRFNRGGQHPGEKK